MKVDPNAVARSMMTAKGTDGNLLFSSSDFLTAKQISGFFSRLAAKKSLNECDLIADVENAAREADLEALSAEVERQLGQTHPIVYDSHNLCELASKEKLDKFSLTVLESICTYFAIDTLDVTGRRAKRPYIDKLKSLCDECECKQ